MRTYMDRELTEATNTIKSSFQIQINGYKNPKSRECDEHSWSVVRLGILPVTASLKDMTDLKLKDNSHLIP